MVPVIMAGTVPATIPATVHPIMGRSDADVLDGVAGGVQETVEV